MSCFLRDGDAVFHTYSTYAGCRADRRVSYFLDLTALGRQEDWEEPKGRPTWPAKPAGLRHLSGPAGDNRLPRRQGRRAARVSGQAVARRPRRFGRLGHACRAARAEPQAVVDGTPRSRSTSRM